MFFVTLIGSLSIPRTGSRKEGRVLLAVHGGDSAEMIQILSGHPVGALGRVATH